MSLTVGVLNLVLGTVYTSYGLLTVADMWRGRRTRGFSHFGLAWVFMAFTCGPHHLHHGVHVAFEGRMGGMLDVIAVAIGLPAGVIWFLLRLEALSGGRGDRFVTGTPGWMEVLPTLAGVYVVWLAAAAGDVLESYQRYVPVVTPNLFLVGLYTAIGVVLLRTQLQNRPVVGGWSVSGLSLSVVFPTCALMHGAYAVYASTGRYVADWHGSVIDSLAVPAAAYFLWVVWSVARGTITDWGAGRGETPHPDTEAEAPIEVVMA